MATSESRGPVWLERSSGSSRRGGPLRRVLWLLALSVAVGVGIDVGLSVLAFDPDVARVLLVAVVLGSVAAVLVETRSEQPLWESRYDRPTVSSGQDGRTSSHVRILEDHRTAATPGPALRDRLRDLTSLTLAAHHGLDLTTGRDRVHPHLLAVLDGPPRRLSAAEVDACLDEIEGLR